jgi:hypothetical protein
MKNNRTIEQYEACGRMNVRPIGASWKNGRSTSSRAVMVNDPGFEQLQHLLPEEAELLHGMRIGCTAGRDATADQRLKAIGNGWDLNVIRIIMSYTKLCKDAYITKTMVTMHTTMLPDDMASVMMSLDLETREHHLQLLQHHYAAEGSQTCVEAGNTSVLPQDDAHHQAATHTQQTCVEAGNTSVLPQDDAHHQAATHNQPTYADAGSIPPLSQDKQSSNTAAHQATEAESDQTADIIATAAIHAAQEALTPIEFAECLLDMDESARDYYLQILAAHYQSGSDNTSVLDSGSAKHLQSKLCILDSDNRTPLAGFDGSTQWTEGNGYLPVTMTDSISGETFLTDFDDVDLMSGNLLSQILSLGKLLRSGWTFHLGDKGKDCYGTTPGGAHRAASTYNWVSMTYSASTMNYALDMLPRCFLHSPQQ